MYNSMQEWKIDGVRGGQNFTPQRVVTKAS